MTKTKLSHKKPRKNTEETFVSLRAPVEKEVAVKITNPEAASDVLAGTRYRTIKELGQGGMGTVYLAEHRDLGRMFAVKVLHEVFTPTAEHVERLRREARAASQIRHPYIVDVTDFGITRTGRAYVVMEYIDGTDLADRLKTEKVIEQREVITIGLMLCDALAAAHARKVIHRDIKPDNIILIESEDEDFHIKLVDFGLALSPEDLGRRLTKQGMVFGTPEYMAPEQVSNRMVTASTDVYSVGVLLYEMLTGKVPHEGSSSFETMAVKLDKPAVPPSERNREVEIFSELEQLVLRCLEILPDDRYETILEVASELSSCADLLDRRSGIAGPHLRESEENIIPAGVQSPRRTAAVLVAIAALIAGISIAWSLFGRDDLDSHDEGWQALVSGRDVGSRLNETRSDSNFVAPSQGDAQVLRIDAFSIDAGINTVVDSGRRPRRTAPRKRPLTNGKNRKKTDTSPSDTAQLIAEGNRLLKMRKLGEARQAFEKASRSSAAQAGLGRVAFEQGRYSEAITHLERALKSQPRSKSLRTLLGSAYLRGGQRSRAIEQWERVLRIDPDNRAARRLLDSTR